MLKSPEATICALASYLPKKILSNFDLEQMVDTSNEWIVSRTGMQERRIAANDEFASDMGYQAALRVCREAEIDPEEIDQIYLGSMTPDYPVPSTASLIQHRLGAKKAAAMDFQAACSGFLYGLNLAKAQVESGLSECVLLVVSEKLSSVVDYEDRNTCVLFGDGAAAAIIRKGGSGFRIGSVNLGSDGQQAELLAIPAGGCRHPATELTVSTGMHYLKMNGKELFKHALRRMEQALSTSLDSVKLGQEEISWLVPHQANIRIIEGLAKRLNFPLEKVYTVIEKYGNTSASSVPVALDDLIQKQEIAVGEKLALVAFGAGLTWGASVLEKV